MILKKNISWVAILAFVFFSIHCTTKNKTSEEENLDTTKNKPSAQQNTMNQTNTGGPYSGAELDQYCSNPKRLLVIETKLGTMKLQLFDKVAPKHVAQITKLAGEKFYDGCTFHRCIPGFMIQGGDPNSKDDDLSNDGIGGAGNNIPAEFSKVHHARGVASMARAGDPNSASSQFFICHADAGFLDSQYTVWGQLIEGYDVLDKIEELPHLQGDNPGKAAAMTKVWVQE
jgi:peptidyl-prolyl cis-trans isomerase B (cyclophilin B)